MHYPSTMSRRSCLRSQISPFPPSGQITTITLQAGLLTIWWTRTGDGDPLGGSLLVSKMLEEALEFVI